MDNEGWCVEELPSQRFHCDQCGERLVYFRIHGGLDRPAPLPFWLCRECAVLLLSSLVKTLDPENAIGDVLLRRVSQDEKWGGADHDDAHTTAEFLGFVLTYVDKAAEAASVGDVDRCDDKLTDVGALALAAIASLRRRRAAGTAPITEGGNEQQGT